MVLICLFIIITLLGFILAKSDIGEDLEIAGGIIVVFGFAFLIGSLIIIIAVHATADISIQKNKMQYEGLCKRYEIVNSDYEDVSKSDVISDITAWNMYVYNTEYWSENPWTNCFNPKKIADNLNYISLEEESEG
jgi:hypothetical protein